MGQSYQKFLDEGSADLISGLATLGASVGAFVQVRRCAAPSEIGVGDKWKNRGVRWKA